MYEALSFLMREHGNCPHCNSDLNGGSIWEHFYNEFTQGRGYWMDEDNKYIHGLWRILSHEEAELVADKVAESYGATREQGRWGRAIGLYDRELDRTVAFKCPDCGETWPR